jgi:hypothetical protein
MTDIPIKSTEKPILINPALEVERNRADAAEARIRELEQVQAVLTVLSEPEFLNLKRQKQIMQGKIEDANKVSTQAADAQAIAIMLNIAYNKTWSDLQKKYGLPDSVDVDWDTGEVFRQRLDKKQE